jgi:hypothetical protein
MILTDKYDEEDIRKSSNLDGLDGLIDYMTSDEYLSSLKRKSATCMCGKTIVINPKGTHFKCPLCNSMVFPHA